VEIVLTNVDLNFLRREHNFAFSDLSILFAILIVYILVWFIHPKPFHASDAWAYSQHAYNISTGSFFVQAPDHIFSHRLGVTIPTAVFYKLFGVNSITTNFWPLVMSCIGIVMVWIASPKNDSRFFAAVLFAACVVQFELSTILMPDLIVSTLMMVSSVILYKRHTLIHLQSVAFLSPVVASIVFWWAFLVKETMYWVVLWWIVIFCHDMFKERWQLFKRFYLPCLFWGIVFGCAYLLMSYHLWGSPLARIESVETLTGEHLWAWDNWHSIEMLRRLTYEPAHMLVRRFGLAFLLSVGGVIVFYSKNRFWVFQYLVYLLLWWFGSSSFTSYQPLPLFARMIVPALPAMSILGGSFLFFLLSKLLSHDSKKSIKNFGYLPLLLLTFLMVAAIGNLSSRRFFFLIVVVFVVSIVPYLKVFTYLDHYKIVALFVVALVSIPMYSTIRDSNYILAERLAEMEVVEIIVTELKGVKGSVLLLCMDKRSPDSLAYYWAYEYPKELTVHYYGDYEFADSAKYDKILLFNHLPRSRFLANAYGDPFLDPELLTKLPGQFLFDKNGVQLFIIDGTIK
jgi:hypothetical protein